MTPISHTGNVITERSPTIFSVTRELYPVRITNIRDDFYSLTREIDRTDTIFRIIRKYLTIIGDLPQRKESQRYDDHHTHNFDERHRTTRCEKT